MGVIKIENAEQFDEHISKSKNDGSLVMVDFSAAWCGPCRMIEPRYAALSDEYPTVVFLKVDVDEVRTVASRVGITAMPTFILYKAGEKVGDVVGANEEAIKGLLMKHLPKA